MTKEQFERLESMELLLAEELTDKSDRTLLYGYTLDRDTYHVYLKDQKIYTVIYDTRYFGETAAPVNMKEISVKFNSEYIPSKRVYPEKSDFEFCSRLKLRGCRIPFTSYGEWKEEKQFYGFTLEDYQGA